MLSRLSPAHNSDRMHNTSTQDYIVGQGLNMSYTDHQGGNIVVFDDLNFSVSKGSIVSIIGPSGCGKTTLLNCIGGLLTLRDGQLTIDGKSPDDARKSRYFGLVPQEPSLFEWKTVFENISLPLVIFGDNQAPERREHIRSLITLVGLQGFEDSYPRALSGGMKQRVSLARALSFGAEVLLMDEPFGALDAQTREQMNFEVLRIWAEIENTMILVTHDVIEAVLLSDRVFAMGHRPSQIKAVLEIDLPRPRHPGLLDAKELHAYAAELREFLRGDAR